jgi:hypothetical protein
MSGIRKRAAFLPELRPRQAEQQREPGRAEAERPCGTCGNQSYFATLQPRPSASGWDTMLLLK